MWNVEEIIKATGGKAQGTIGKITSVSIDSRSLGSGALFVALKGDRVDGHNYVKDALSRGATAAIVSHIPDNMEKNAPLIIVEDTYQALIALAAASRKRMKGKVIAVTGSVGKTGTKEAIRTTLSGRNVYATKGNLNNHIGLPLSLSNLAADTAFGVFELGMNHAGEISFLTNMLCPDIALITNVEAVHLEFFESVERIADAKAEIMEGLPKDGTIVLNRDNVYFEYLHEKVIAQGIKNIISFGEHFDATCRLTKYEIKDLGSQVEAVIAGIPLTYRLGTIGRHWALTSLAALAAVTAAGVDVADAAEALANFHEPEGRGRIQAVRLPKGGSITLIDDCYNASPISMNGAIEKLAEFHASLGKSAGRKLAILGDMLELGDTSADLHKSLLAALERYDIDKLYAAGKLMKHLYDTTPAAMRGAYAATSAELETPLMKALKDGDIVLIKGSHGSRMDIVRDAIRREFADAI